MKISTGHLSVAALSLVASLGLSMPRPAAADVAQSADAAQPSDAAQNIAALMNQVRSGGTRDVRLVRSAPPEQTLVALSKYLSDPEHKVRREAVNWISDIATRSAGTSTRQQGVRLLLNVALSHPDAATADDATQGLSKLSRLDFTRDMRQAIYQKLAAQRDARLVSGSMIRLLGVAGVQEAAAWLRAQAASDTKGGSIRDTARLAQLSLARLGDQTATQSVVLRSRSAADAVERVESLDDLSFIRQPASVAELVHYLFSDEKTPWDGSDVPSVRYAYEAVDHLSEIIEDFPVRKGPYMDAYVATARQWVIAQGGTANLKIKQ